MAVIAPLYIALIIVAELLTVLGGIGQGFACHALLVVALLNHFIALGLPSKRDLADPNASFWFVDVLPVLALVPLARLLTLAIILPWLPPLVWHALIGALFLLAIWLTARLLGHTWADLGLSARAWPWQAVVALSGAPLGLAAYLIVRPQPLTTELAWPEVFVGVAILTLAVGLPSELTFRGMLLRSATEIFGRPGVVWSGVLFAAMHLIWRSPGYVAFAFCLAVFFGWVVRRSGSLVGVTLANGLLTGGMLLVWPHLLR
jgi:membrane protease YdiL (CAAX protease family)